MNGHTHLLTHTHTIFGQYSGISSHSFGRSYMFSPKFSHELALKRIGRYLKNTFSCGMVINPTRELTIDAYPDADFAGMYGHEKPTDLACAKSRSGFVIVFAGVSVYGNPSYRLRLLFLQWRPR